MKMKRSILCALVCAFILLIPLSACGSGTISSSNLGDLEKIQRKVPFTIILPTYLPDGIGPNPYLMQGPFKIDEEILLVKIEYQKRGSDGDIFIQEQNSSFNINSYPAPGSESTYLDINGIKILEEKIPEVLYPPTTPTKYGFSYYWNKNGTDFDVTIFGYDKDECRKIVESMIQP